jgi:hypothetical protein
MRPFSEPRRHREFVLASVTIFDEGIVSCREILQRVPRFLCA